MNESVKQLWTKLATEALDAEWYEWTDGDVTGRLNLEHADEVFHLVRVRLSHPLPDSVVAFDFANLPSSEHILFPSLTVMKPTLQERSLLMPFEITGFFQRDEVSHKEDFIGQFRWDAQGQQRFLSTSLYCAP